VSEVLSDLSFLALHCHSSCLDGHSHYFTILKTSPGRRVAYLHQEYVPNPQLKCSSS
jgi:hypothetical protein